MSIRIEYLAGAIDHHAKIYYHKRSKKLVLRFRSRDEKFLQQLKHHHGGSVYSERVSMVYEVTSDKALALLKSVCKGLIVQRTLVENILKHSKTS